MGDDDDRRRRRDTAAPMTAHWPDIIRGAGHAWLVFMVVLLAAVAVTAGLEFSGDAAGSPFTPASVLGASLLWTALIGGGVSLLVTAVGMPLAWLCARALRRRRSMAFHAAAWAVFGLLVGPATIAVFCAASGDAYLLTTPFAPASAAATGISVLYGWWRASRRVRRAIASSDPRAPIGLDRAFADD
ncbi:hypothetical protein M3667_03210 [Microbacterium sp. P26]|uniref:hypothetical protein n=1 Tax=Microbacterium TaxID=33882 RepID=UPI00203AE5F1|nr:hypothetical protein [Microbacterium sp. P26]MCM3500886.1 hypothetical protein [Microbacterium sp. P26]